MIFCPHCGEKMERKLAVEIPRGSYDETSIRYKCLECDDEWNYSIDSMNQTPTLTKIC